MSQEYDRIDGMDSLPDESRLPRDGSTGDQDTGIALRKSRTIAPTGLRIASFWG